MNPPMSGVRRVDAGAGGALVGGASSTGHGGAPLHPSLPRTGATLDERTTTPYNGRITEGDPLPLLSPEPSPAPNDEDRRTAATTGRSAEYWAELRTVRSSVEWEAAGEREAERQAKEHGK